MTTDPNLPRRPLEGIRVLDLTVALAGPYCTLLLAGLGAEVIKIEAPTGGDIARFNPPFYGKDGIHLNALEEGDISLSILARARSKKSLSLDLKSEQGLQLFKKLVQQSDIVVENLSDGTVERLGVDYASLKELNPELIYCSITGMGRPSPFPGLKVMDIAVQALSGVMDTTGENDGPPTRLGLPMADLLAPLYGMIGIQSALLQRAVTGQGQHVMVSMMDCLSSLLPFEHFDVLQRMGFPARTGNHQTRLAPFGVFETRDGHVSIAAANDKWAGLIFEAMGAPEMIRDPKYATRGPRAVNADEVNGRIEAWTRTLSSEEAIEELFTKRGVPCVKVRTALEAMSDPVLRESGAIVPLVHPEAGEIDAVGPGVPIRMSQSTVCLDRPAPALGANTAELLGDLLGMSNADLAALKEQGVV